jgi:hypothetical protein
MLCGSENWNLCKAYETLLGGFEGKILKRIYGAVHIDGVSEDVLRRNYIVY